MRLKIKARVWLDKLIYSQLTIGTYVIFFVKLSLNEMIGYLLGLIVAAGVVLDINPMRKGYISLTLVIIFCLALDRHIRATSKMFDMISTIFRPVNTGIGMRKIIKNSNYVSLLLFIMLIEVIKILCGVYCVVILAIEVKTNVYVNYCLFALLFLESLLGFIIYFELLFFTLIRKNFFSQWLEWMGKWYLKNSVDCVVTHNKHTIILEFMALEI